MVPLLQTHGPSIDMAAHCGGLVSGFIFGFLGARPLEPGRRQAMIFNRRLALLIGIGSLMALLFIPVLKSNPLLNIDRGDKVGFEMYYRGMGEGVATNAEESVHWLKQAADLGHVNSQYTLGSMYYRGDGVEKDNAEAMSWFTKAAEQGDINSEKAVAGGYFSGQGVPTNTLKGIEWLTKIANTGCEYRDLSDTERGWDTKGMLLTLKLKQMGQR